MNDEENEAGELEEGFDPVETLAAPAQASVLADVSHQRARDDQALGYFRDYRDGTAVSQLDKHTLNEAIRRMERSGNQLTWRLMGDVLAAEVNAQLDASDLRKALVAQAAHAVAWAEALDRRKDERRIARKTADRFTLRWRIASWFRRLFRRTF